MSKVRFYQAHAGEAWYEKQGIAWEQCCDCGLVHKVKYTVHDAAGKPIKGAKVQITAWQVEYLTKRVRRQRRKNGTLKLDAR